MSNAIDFEPTDVKDLELPKRSVVEGANVIDYDVEYGVLPVDPEQLAAPTHNVAVPAEGTLDDYATDGTETAKFEVVSVSLKEGGAGYVKDEVVTIAGVASSDVPAEVTVKSVTPDTYTVSSATASGTMSGYKKDEIIGIAGAEGDIAASLKIEGVTSGIYVLNSIQWQSETSGYVTGETVTIPTPGASDPDIVITLTATDGVVTGVSADEAYAVDFTEDIAGTYTSADYTYAGSGTGLVLQLDCIEAELGGAITGLEVVDGGKYASDISGSINAAKIVYSGEGSGAEISDVCVVSPDSGEILSIELKSAGEYSDDLDGVHAVVSENGSGASVEVVAEKILTED